MKITIVGAGAIGGVIGAYAARAGHEIVFCDIAAEHVAAIRANGLRIEGPEESFTVQAPAYTPAELVERGEALTAVFLCVKAHHTAAALEPLLPLLAPDGFVLSLQNGLCEHEIAELVGASRTVGCFVNFSADYLEPGRILYGGVAALYIGELDGVNGGRVQGIAEVLSSWGPVQVTDNIQGYLWGKLSYAGLLYATALVDETMAAVVREGKVRAMLLELCSEILDVAACEGVTSMGFDDWEPALVHPRETRQEAVLAAQLEKLAARMAANRKQKSGIWRDLAVRKRKTEVEAQLLPLIVLGEQHGLPMPLTRKLVSYIQEIETGARQMNWHNLYELRDTFEEHSHARPS